MKQVVVCYLPIHNGVQLTPVTWGMIDIAKKLAKKTSSPLIGIIIHAGIDIKEISVLPFDEIYHARLEQKNWRAADYHIQVFEQIVGKVSQTSGIYLFSSDPLYHELAIRLSVRNQANIITNAQEIMMGTDSNFSFTVKREIYNGKAHEFVTCNSGKQKYITFDQSILYADVQRGTPNRIEEVVTDQHCHSQIQFLSSTKLDWKELKITEARCVIGIGRGVYGKSVTDIVQLAELLNAPIGGSKVADELQLIPRENRIGSSGSSIDADIYIAIGISGSSQHLDGIKRVKHVIAINNDSAAPIFQKSGLGIVGDFGVVVPKLVESLKVERQRESNDEHYRVG